jgi:hypothetical protein
VSQIAYGEVQRTADAGTAVAVPGTFVKLGVVTVAGLLNELTAPSSNNLTFQGTTPKRLHASASLAFTCSLNGQDVLFRFAQNGVTIAASEVVVSSGATGSQAKFAALTDLIDVDPGEFLEVWVTTGTLAATVTLAAFSFAASEIVETGVAATTPTDFDLLTDPAFLAVAWPPLVRILRSLRAHYVGLSRSGTYPAQVLYQLLFGTLAGATPNIRLDASLPGQLSIQSWNGAAWVDLVVLTDGLQALQGPVQIGGDLQIAGELTGVTDLTMSGALALSVLTVAALAVTGPFGLDMNGNPISNVSDILADSVNGVDPATHGARHTPAGADPIPTGDPVAIGDANAEGAGASLARVDHVHEGVHSVTADGGADTYGDVNLVPGALTSIVKAGQDLTIAHAPVQAYLQLFGGANWGFSGAGPARVQDNAGTFLQIQLAVFAGTKDFRITFGLTVGRVGNTTVSIQVRVGAAGTVADPIVWACQQIITGAATEPFNIGHADIEVTGVASAAFVTITIDGGAATVRAATEAQHLSVVEKG